MTSPRTLLAVMWVAAHAAGLVLLVPAVSRGDQPPSAEEAKRQAAIHFDRGVQLSNDQDWRAALIEFERAYSLSPHDRVLYDIAQCRKTLRDYAGALRAFQDYLAGAAADGHPVPADRRQAVQKWIEQLRGRVAEVRPSTNLAGAEISVDDVPVGNAPLSSPLMVNAGRHKVSAEAGSVTIVSYIEVAGEDSIDVPLLVPSPPAETAPAPPPAGADSARPLGAPRTSNGVSSPSPAPAGRVASTSPASPADTAGASTSRGPRSLAPSLVAFGVSAAGAGLGAMFGLVAVSDKTSLDRDCVSKACPESSQSLIDDSRRAATLATVGFTVAVVGLGAGLAYLLWPAGRPRSGSSPAVSAPVVVRFGPGVLVGTF